MVRVAVIFPSRGLAFSATCEELLDNLEGFDYDIFFAHGLSIPNCFNTPLREALRGSYTHFFFVEDDMVLPKNTLKRLLAENVPAITCDYPMDAEGKPAILRDPTGYAIYGGTGCLLVTREFLSAYKEPIFHSDTAWDIKIGETVVAKPRKIRGDVYGLHDVNFYFAAPSPIKVSFVRCGHRKLVALGQVGTNNGEHQIEVWTKLKPNKLRTVKSKMVGVEIDGQIVNVRAESPLAKDYKPKYLELL